MKETGARGWVIIGLFVLIYDVFVMRKGKQSLSQAVWEKTTHPYYGPAIAGFWTALTYHLFIDKPKQNIGSKYE